VINGLCVIEASVGMVLMALAPNVVLAVMAVALLTLGLTGYSPSFTIMSAIVAPPRLRAQAISYTLLFTVIGGIGIQPTIGYIGDTIGERKAMVILGVMVGVAGAVETTVRRFVRRDVAEAVKLTTASESDSMLTVRGLDVAYDGGVQVLFGVDFDVSRGEVIALLGTNGAGKSTLLRAISGLMDPIGGAIFFDGRDITHADATQKSALGIVQVPGGRGVFPGLTVGENLRLAGWLFRKDPEYLREANERVLGYFPILREFWDRQAADLSGGQQQMLTLAQALLAKPKLLMIDELSLGLAPVIVEQLLDVVRQLAADGTTIVLVEQSVNVALSIAHKAYFMEKGEVRFSGPTSELLDRPDVLRSVFLEGAASRQDASNRAAEVRGQGTTTVPARVRRVDIGPDAEVALSVRGLEKRFGGVKAVDDVSFDLYRRQILGIIGPNGAGKTTLFDIISGFTPPDEGTIILEGLNVTSFGSDTRARLGLGRSFQDARLFPSLTVRDTIALSLERGLDVRDPVAIALNVPEVIESERNIAARVDELIDLMRLGAFRDKFISELSTGSRRIVDLACVLAHEPTVVLFDEPSSGIAQRETEALGPLLQRIREASDAALLVIEHDMPLITSISDELIALDLGRVVTRGSPEEVQNDPQVIASYLGTSDVVVSRSGAVSPREVTAAPVRQLSPRRAARAAARAERVNAAGPAPRTRRSAD
jgi:branched-chain amino acid transport system ATP-binding protein